MTNPTNTTSDARANPLNFIAAAMVLGSSGAIEAQEAAGQHEVVNSTAIPTEMNCTAEDLEALGFGLGEVHAGDPMFREATLPPGWTREGSGHSMWSYIVDERGFRRCCIFYKAAFYDRSAYISIQREPATKAQDDSYDAFRAWCPRADGWTLDTRKDGDNLVRRASCFDGRLRERVIAPSGSIVEERETTA